ncbi:hypothetical protein DLAC_07355 [Tieghemostelium lacteum]|uniref:Cytochrome c oxidase assembly factor 5 n=1 Tax=Tieghemostelium lacteum TaxID=361077 RepID=A0A151ZCC2_TIELA|nr:hypothetical protein DLAC_07355 [Tieghemostelium lacteum]|eukprot:KYQ91588.1 hypothetical protein DLAC_07355 [Tieghemostelium lacteum]
MSLPESTTFDREPQHPCQSIKNSIVECIKNSECMASGKTFHECLKSKDLAQTDKDCSDLLYTYFKCKTDMFDTRSRFRGNVTAQTWEKDITEKRRTREEKAKESNVNSKPTSN